MDYPSYRSRAEHVSKGDGGGLAFLAKRAREKKAALRNATSATSAASNASDSSQQTTASDGEQGSVARAFAVDATSEEKPDKPIPRRKSGVYAITEVGIGDVPGAVGLGVAGSGRRPSSDSKDSHTTTGTDSAIPSPRRVSFADIEIPSSLGRSMTGQLQLTSTQESAEEVEPEPGPGDTAKRSILKRDTEGWLSSSSPEGSYAPLSPSSSSVLSFDLEGDSATSKRRTRMRRDNSAELRYGTPPLPYSTKPIVVEDRRVPAPTLQQIVKGKRRRSRDNDNAKQSTWQVEDFAMLPTTIDCRNVYYSPQKKTVRTRLLSALPCLQRGNTSGGGGGDAEASPNPSLSTFESPAPNDSHFILKNVTFRINPGSLVAVMGPSGCGKTSLLDVIAKRYQGHIHGSVLFNGQRRTMFDVKKQVGYVLQNDSLLPALTVEETIVFMGKLRLPPRISDEELKIKVANIIKELGLQHVANSPVGDGETIRGLSGGERRRVSIGIQLLVAPGILLLDEPTTGLDSFNANQLLRTLSKLACKQHLVMVTIHQPRSDLFRMFNNVILLNAGELVWAGSSSNMLTHFQQINFQCPPDANPLQYYVTLASVSTSSATEKMKTTELVAKLKVDFSQSQFYKNMREEIGWDSTPLRKLRAMSQSEPDNDEPFERPSAVSKLLTLTRRAFSNTFRSRGAVFTRTFQLPLLAIYLLIFFTRLRNDQQSVQNRNGLFLETMVEVTLASAVAAISLCPPLLERYHRESSEGMYGAALFILSYLVHSVPFTVVSSLLWTLIMYLGAGLQVEAARFFIYWCVVFLLHLIGECIAVLMLGLVSSIPMADSVSTFFIMVTIALGGGVYRVASTVPLWLQYLSLLTPFKYSGAIMAVNEFRELHLTCETQVTETTLMPTAAVTAAMFSADNQTTTKLTAGANMLAAYGASNGSSGSSGNCLWVDGDHYLNESIVEWQRESQGLNFGVLIGLLFVYYLLTLLVFVCRRKILH